MPALLGAVAALLLAAPMPAMAQEIPAIPSPTAAAPRIAALPADDRCGAADGSGMLAGSDATLAINRWADVADTFHDRLDGDVWNDVSRRSNAAPLTLQPQIVTGSDCPEPACQRWFEQTGLLSRVV